MKRNLCFVVIQMVVMYIMFKIFYKYNKEDEL